MTTYGPVISSTGITTQSYDTLLSYLKTSMQNIYGSDIVVDNDSQDGQALGIFALALKDAQDAVASAYYAYSPSTAQGTGLSSQVKINGIARLSSSNSTAPVVITGDAGTTITGGIVGDNQSLNTKWSIPTTTIPSAGTITTTATSTTAGSVSAAVGTLTKILTPTRGWLSVTNTSAATPGDDIEDDATLRSRQSSSVSLPATSVTASIKAAIANITGVTRSRVYENDTDVVDADGLPKHSISCVVEGGDVSTIASAIWTRKTPGTGTYGTTSSVVYDTYGLGTTISYFTLETVPVYVSVTIAALSNYLSSTADKIIASFVLMLNSAGIGVDIYYGDLWSVANLSGTYATSATGLTQAELDVISATYKITAIKVGTTSSPTSTSDVTIAFNKAASGSTSNIIVTLGA